MKSSPTSIIPVIAKSEGKNMSRLQKQFNSRIKKIQKLKTQIEEVEQAMLKIRSLIHRELQPLQDKINSLKARIVKQLDQAWEMKFFRSKEKAKLQELICHNAYELIQSGQENLEALYDKHAPTSYQEEAQFMNENGKEMASAMFKNLFDVDLDLNEVDMNDFGQVSEKLFASIGRTRPAGRREAEEQEKDQSPAKTRGETQGRNRAYQQNLARSVHPPGRGVSSRQRDRRSAAAVENRGDETGDASV